MDNNDYKNLIPKFSNQEELESCNSVKITCKLCSGPIDGFDENQIYKIFDGNDSVYFKCSKTVELYFQFNRAINIKSIDLITNKDEFPTIGLYCSDDNKSWEKVYWCNAYEYKLVGNFRTNEKKDVEFKNKHKYFKICLNAYYIYYIYSLKLFTTSNEKILIKQDKSYLIIQPDQYSNNNFGLLTPPGDELPTVSNFNEFGLDDLSAVCSDMTVGDETFKPIDKIKDKFNVIIMNKK